MPSVATQTPEQHALYYNEKIRIYDDQWTFYYDNGYYGTKEDNHLELYLEEALLLVERGKLFVHDLDLEVEEPLKTEAIKSMPLLSTKALIQRITKNSPGFWNRYLVYRDLRGRGYVVRQGFGSNSYRRYPRGTKAGKGTSNIIVFPFAEGRTLELYELEQLIQQAKSNRKSLILGITDRIGDITYYKASEFEVPYNKAIYEWADQAKVESFAFVQAEKNEEENNSLDNNLEQQESSENQ